MIDGVVEVEKVDAGGAKAKRFGMGVVEEAHVRREKTKTRF